MAASPSSPPSSLYTTTSSSTQWGPGAMAGKAILALGKAVVRGAEHFIILRRLSAIKSAMPCSDPVNSGQSQRFEKMFGDVLELSRKGLYPEAIRIQAMQIIVVQIAGRHIHYLLWSLSRWDIDHDELVALLCEIVAITLFPNRGFPPPELVGAYRSALPDNMHPWSPCIYFMGEVAQLTEGTFRAVLDARFLEAILWAVGAQLRAQTRIPSLGLEAECDRALAVLSRPPSQGLLILWIEQIRRYCPDQEPLVSVIKVADAVSTNDLWSTVEARLLDVQGYSMLQTAFAFLTSEQDMIRRMEPYEAFQPTMAFFFPSQPARSTIAMHNFIRCVTLGCHVHTETEQYLSHLSYAKMVLAVTHLIRHLVAPSSGRPDGSTVGVSIDELIEECPNLPEIMIQFLLDISSTQDILQDALLDAAVLNISPFLKPPWNTSGIYGDIYRRMHFGLLTKYRPPHHPRTTALLQSIRLVGLETIVDVWDDEGTLTQNRVHFLQPLVARPVV